MTGRTLIDLTSYPVRCPLCGEHVTRLDIRHATSHGYSRLKDFREACGCSYETLQQRSYEKFLELYNIDFTRWCSVVWASSGDPMYVTNQYHRDDYEDAKANGKKSARKFPLSRSTFYRHMAGNGALAIFAHGSTSKFFGFDVDTKDSALQDTLKLVHALETSGIPRELIHVSFSGSKGYHIELFVDRGFTFEEWNTFGAYIVGRAGLIGSAIEFRPHSNNSYAWKLPLTLHHKTGNFAGYCDRHTFETIGVLESHDYLFSIRPMSREILFPILAEARKKQPEIERIEEEQKEAVRQSREAVKVNNKELFQSPEEKEKEAIRYLEKGLRTTGTRWNATRKIARFLYHNQGLEIDEIRPMLLNWTETQIENGKVTTPFTECVKEIDAILEWIPRSSPFRLITKEISITRGEVEWVLGISFHTSARDLLWALLLRHKVYARNGTFYTSDTSLQKLLPKKLNPRTGKISETDRRTISRWRKWLIAHGYIEADTPVDSKQRSRRFYNHQATTYRLLFEETEDREVIDTVEFSSEMDCRELLRLVASKLYGTTHLERYNLAA